MCAYAKGQDSYPDRAVSSGSTQERRHLQRTGQKRQDGKKLTGTLCPWARKTLPWGGGLTQSTHVSIQSSKGDHRVGPGPAEVPQSTVFNQVQVT